MTSRLWLTMLLCLSSLLVACETSSVSMNPCEPRAINVLFIGNSLTNHNDLPGLLSALADSAGVGPITYSNASIPAYGLQDHWVNTQTRAALALGVWDLVVLQQGPSATEGRPSLLEYSAMFADEARSLGADVALYMVWPSFRRFSYFGAVYDSYRTAAENVDGLFLPCGESWRVAWETNPQHAFYGPDAFHPSPLGTYIAALVMFQQLTGCSPVGLPSQLTTRTDVRYNIDSKTAREVQEAAALANRRHALGGPKWPEGFPSTKP